MTTQTHYPTSDRSVLRVPAVQAFLLGMGAFASGAGVVLWFVLRSNRVPETPAFIFLIGPYVLIGVTAVSPWIRDTGWGVLVIGLVVVLAFGSVLAITDWSGWGGLLLLPAFIIQYVLAGLTVVIALATWPGTQMQRDSILAGRPDLIRRGIRIEAMTAGLFLLLVGTYSLFQGRLTDYARQAWEDRRIRPDGVPLPLPRSEYQKPEYLTPERRSRNLLLGGSFEEPALQWTTFSGKGNPASASVVSDVSKTGRVSARLQSDQPDSCSFDQLVTVKARTWYLLSGWMKTKDVEVAEHPDKQHRGASVLLNSHDSLFIASLGIRQGTTEWEYVSFVFNSTISSPPRSDRSTKEIQYRVRLFLGSKATGTAWFDDLVLIELP